MCSHNKLMIFGVPALLQTTGYRVRRCFAAGSTWHGLLSELVAEMP